MATLVLQTAGAVIGSFVGGPIGAAIGSTIGTVVGSSIDQSVIGSLRSGGKTVQGSRLKDLDGITASEGAPIPRLYGRARLGGQIIWATRFDEEAVVTKTKARGGKGGIGGSLGKSQKQVSYLYYANVAIGLCEGEIAFVRRVWADGKLLDLTNVTMRVHRGAEEQPADPLIVAKQGAAASPAYRGLTYVVFERFPLEAYGNRLPQMTFEVVRPVHGLYERIQAVTLIPGSGEHVYETREISVGVSGSATSLPNRTQLTHPTNWAASLDALQALCPNLRNISLVVSWFGNDLRAGNCEVRPLTEIGARDAIGMPWSVAGLSRVEAGTVSSVDGNSAFGGTPSDQSVMRAIRDLKARGLSVTLYPFIMMDIPPNNQLSNPWNGSVSQPAYPWRGRITCSPAPGQLGSVDMTTAAQMQVSSFMGAAVASQFQVGPDSVVYSGAAQAWRFSRFILHMAALAKAAGGVDSFILGSELASLTRVRGVGAVNPFVAGLKQLAGEARILLGTQTKISYGADWTEYGADIRAGGSDVRFPLDPLWADSNIDMVALDWYPPITDWRDGSAHLDAAVYDGPHDHRLFNQGIMSGEGFDWYYADDVGRVTQNRLPITDGAYNKPWIYRPKDLLGWWSNAHFERINGIENPSPTAWIPQSKPIWLLELGCPAVDRGGNSPNVFPDPKSSENALPYFSRGGRDDCVQARHLIATLDHFALPHSGPSLSNPISAVYGGPMLSPQRIYLWAYDARPFPAFPDHAAVWADADAYETGHWLNGRLEGGAVDDLIAAILRDFGHDISDRIEADGFVDGYVLDRPMSVRAALTPLTDLFAFDALVHPNKLTFSRRLSKPISSYSRNQCVAIDGEDRVTKNRSQASELPTALTLAFNDPDSDFRQAAVRVIVEDAQTEREAAVELPLALKRSSAFQRASVILNELRTSRETIRFALPLSQSHLEPGDNIIFDGQTYRIRRMTDGLFRSVEAAAFEPGHYLGGLAISRPKRRAAPRLSGQPSAIILDLPVANSATPTIQYLAARVEPWPGSLTLWRSNDGSSFEAIQQIVMAATIGVTTTALLPGKLWLTDRQRSVDISIGPGTLETVSEMALLQGSNLIAIGSNSSGWEIISFAKAELLAPGQWRLSTFIRGLAGSEVQAQVLKVAGSKVVLLDGAINELATGYDLFNRKTLYRLSAEGKDHADAQAVQFEATAGPLALMPLSPVHIKARRKADGIHLSWIRRTRYGGDSWEIAEVPLNEESEAYQVDIFNGTTLKRSLKVSSPSAVYLAMHEVADFGSMQTNLTLRIRQISATVGPGFANQTTLLVA